MIRKLSKRFLIQQSGVEDSPAKTSASLIKESGKDYKGTGAGSSTDLLNLLNSLSQNGSFSKMSWAFSIATTEETSKLLSRPWMNSGIAWRGEYWTQSTSERPNADEERLLSQVIETQAPQESFLTTSQLTQWMNRHGSRGHTLPVELQRAIETQISLLSSMPPSAEKTVQAHRQKDTDLTVKRTPSIQEEAQTLYVRRMLASEYEALQGFPTNWTDVDSDV